MASPHSANLEMSDDEKTEDEEEDGGNIISDKSNQSSPFTARFNTRDLQKESFKLKDIIQGQNQFLHKMVSLVKYNLSRTLKFKYLRNWLMKILSRRKIEINPRIDYPLTLDKIY